MSPVIFNIYFIFTFSFKFLTSLYFLAIQCQKELQNVNVKKPCMDVYNPHMGGVGQAQQLHFLFYRFSFSQVILIQCSV